MECGGYPSVKSVLRFGWAEDSSTDLDNDYASDMTLDQDVRRQHSQEVHTRF